MRRLLATTTLALTFVAAPACDKKEEEKKDASAKAGDKKDGDAKDGDAKDGGKAGEEKTADAAPAGGSDLMGMIPEGAKIVATVDLGGLMGSALYKQQSAALEASDLGKNIAAAKACNIGPDTWKQVVLGVDPDGDDAVMLGMAVTGIGKKENIECIAGKYKEQDATADWKIEDKDGRTVITIDGGEAIAYAVDDDTIVMSGKAWHAAVQERIGGKGSAAKDGSLKDAMGLLPAKGHITFAGVATPDMATGPLSGAKHFGGALDLSAGLTMDATVAFGDAGSAKTASDAINQQFQGLKGMASGMGVPQGVVDSVKIEAKEATMTLAFKATTEELEQVGKAAMGMMMAGGPR